MGKYTFLTVLTLFIFILSGVLFYWFGFRPKKIREDCLAISLNATLDDYTDRKQAKKKVSSYFRKRMDLGDESDTQTREAKEEGLFLIAQQKEGYRVCLELNGLKG